MTLAALGVELTGIAGFDRGAATLDKFASSSSRAGNAANDLTQRAEKATTAVGRMFGANSQAARYAQEIDRSSRSLMGFEAVAARAAVQAEYVTSQIEKLSAQDIRDTEIQEYGREMDRLRAKFNPLFAASKQYETALGEINRAHIIGAINAQEQASAIARLDAEYTMAARSANAFSLAGQKTALSMGAVRANARNLSFQLIDIGQSIPLAFQSPLYFLQNLGFQMAQISQIYMGGGGLKQAFTDIVGQLSGFARFLGPIAIGVGAVSVAVAGLAYEINKTAAVQVSFFDVALAGWQLFSEAIGAGLAPAWNGIVAGLQWVWDQMVPTLKGMGNGIIAPFAFALEAIGVLWQRLPAAIGDAMITTANVIIKGIEWSINGATRLLNGFLGKYNEGLAAMGQQTIPLASGITIPQASNPYQGALGQLGAGIDTAALNAGTTDYMGDMFGAISERAQKIASAKQEIEGLGGAAGAANDNVKKLADDGMSALEEKAFDVAEGLRSAFQGIGSGILDAIKQGGDVAGNVLDMLMDKLSQFASSWLDNIINNGIDAIFGGGFNMFGGGMSSGMRGTSSITGSSGGFFPGFDGGGYTGSGGRYGGLDGKGGFLAMMHPQESVIDHTRGQAANQNQRPQVSFSTNIINNAGVEVTTTSVEDGQGGVRQDVVLSRAVAGAISNPGPANTAARTVGKRVRR